MENDFEQLREILEMAELLSDERERILEVETYNDTTGNTVRIIYEFNEDQELTNIYVED